MLAAAPGTVRLLVAAQLPKGAVVRPLPTPVGMRVDASTSEACVSRRATIILMVLHARMVVVRPLPVKAGMSVDVTTREACVSGRAPIILMGFHTRMVEERPLLVNSSMKVDVSPRESVISRRAAERPLLTLCST